MPVISFSCFQCQRFRIIPMCNAKQRHHRNSKGPRLLSSSKTFRIVKFQVLNRGVGLDNVPNENLPWRQMYRELCCHLLRITTYLPDCKLLKACFLTWPKIVFDRGEWDADIMSKKAFCLPIESPEWTKTINNRQKQAYHKNNSPAFKQVSLRTRRIDNMLKACLSGPIIQS